MTMCRDRFAVTVTCPLHVSRWYMVSDPSYLDNCERLASCRTVEPMIWKISIPILKIGHLWREFLLEYFTRISATWIREIRLCLTSNTYFFNSWFYKQKNTTSIISHLVVHRYDTKIRYHNASVLGTTRKDAIANLPGDWVIYDEISQQDFSKSIRTCTLVGDVPLVLFGGNFSTQPVATGILIYIYKYIDISLS